METQIKQLERLGFSRYEASAYVALLKQSPQNGYELAKTSGVPRANIYAILKKLEARGAVLKLDTLAGARYAAVGIEELIQQQEARFTEILDKTRESLTGLASEPAQGYVWNAQGYDAMLDHARAVLQEAREQVWLAVCRPEAAALHETVQALTARGVRVSTVCLSGCPAETCGNCRGKIYRNAILPARPTRWLLAVPDNTELLASEIGPDDQTLTIRTRQSLLIDLARANMQNSIALAAVLEDLGGGLEGGLRPETKEMLGALALQGRDTNWMTQLRAASQDASEESDSSPRAP